MHFMSTNISVFLLFVIILHDFHNTPMKLHVVVRYIEVVSLCTTELRTLKALGTDRFTS